MHSEHVSGHPVAGFTLTVVGKGRKTRHLPMHPDTAERVLAAAGWVFPSNRGDGHLSPTRLAGRLERANGGAFTPHQLRHRYATVMYHATGDLLHVSKLLGHSNVATTQRYVQPAAEAMRRVAAAAW